MADVATNPSSSWVWQTGKHGSDFTKSGKASRVRIEGVHDGINIRVIFEPATQRIVTAFPPGCSEEEGDVDIRAAQAQVLRLADESPVQRQDVLTDIRESAQAGKVALAFDTLCSWICEDDLVIEREYYMSNLGAALGQVRFLVLLNTTSTSEYR